MQFEILIQRAAPLVATLPQADQGPARELLALCEKVASRAAGGDEGCTSSQEREQLTHKRDLARLTELMGRRTTRSLPIAALGRASLSMLAGDARSAMQFLVDCDRKLALLEM